MKRVTLPERSSWRHPGGATSVIIDVTLAWSSTWLEVFSPAVVCTVTGAPDTTTSASPAKRIR